MTAQTEGPRAKPQRSRFEWPRSAVLGLGATLLGFLCWRMVTPFLPAFCWAFALALIADPIHKWLLRKSVSAGVSSLIVIVLVLAVLIAPGAVLARARAGEASDVADRLTSAGGIARLRETVENASVIGPVLMWLDSRFDLPQEAMQLARSVAGWASVTVSAIVTGSMWLLSQIAVTLFALFYFLRDGEIILGKMRCLIPLPASQVDATFSRIAQTIRVSLGGKIVVASIQGALGGLMFFWLGLPAPVFWGSVMAVLSIFPVLGAFVVWVPAAMIFVLQKDWPHALLLAGWGMLIIHPVDNLLGPVLVGTTLRVHTLLMFLSILGGIAAFGASGVVLGPVTVAIAIGVFESPLFGLSSGGLREV